MITVFGLAYQVPEYFYESVRSIIDNASEPIRLIITDNKSSKSEEIASLARGLVDMGMASEFIQMANNPMIRSFNWMYENYTPNSEPFFVFTELDVVVPDGVDWIAELRRMQKSAVMTGFPLDLTNYVPPNGGHLDVYPECALWLLGLRRDIFADEYGRKLARRKKPLSDGWIRYNMGKRGKVDRSEHRLIHKTWDLWKEPGYEEYWQRKEKGIAWSEAPLPVVEYIYKGNVYAK